MIYQNDVTNLTNNLFSDVHFYVENFSRIKEHQIGIIGWDPSSMRSFRKAFYSLGNHVPNSIIDLGIVNDNFRDAKLRPILEALNHKIPLIVVGGPSHLFSNPTHALISKDLKPNTKSKVLGYQRHNLSKIQYLDFDFLDHLSLGDCKGNIKMVEPFLRDVASVEFNLSSIKKSESQFRQSNVSGFSIEEGCQIARYAGMSPISRLLHLSQVEEFDHQDSIESIALLSWYFIEGLTYKKFETPEDADNTCYLIENESIENPLTFYKNESDRWWLKVGEKDYISCHYEDYKSCLDGSIPDKFLSLILA